MCISQSRHTNPPYIKKNVLIKRLMLNHCKIPNECMIAWPWQLMISDCHSDMERESTVKENYSNLTFSLLNVNIRIRYVEKFSA